MKILSPAGDMPSLVAALAAGADEVYLGVKNFNARNIEGFSLSTLKDAVELAHIHNAKVNLTVNILFKDNELQSAIDLIVDAYNLGVDSFIMQDIGLISLTHAHYPQIEIHASTQMGIHNLEGVKEIEKLGVKRVVLSRETPLSEIKRIKENSSVEIEYFCHGALCVSFSGNCYMSSYLFNASGNRGKCKQLCRLPYTFKYKNKEIKRGYLLSAKDFNMLANLDDLYSAGVDVLKIEGRARRPYYVYTVTKAYKAALCGEPYNLLDLKLAFNRGSTNGYFNGNGNIISNNQNHIGIEVGKLKKFIRGKKFNEAFFSSNTTISPKSVLKFIKDNKETVVTSYDLKKTGDTYRLTTTLNLEEKSTIYLISDFSKEQAVEQFTPKRNINLKINAKENKKIQAEFTINNNHYVIFGETCLSAKTAPLTIDEINKSFLKSKHFNFVIESEITNAFLPKQKLNEFRRTINEKIEQILTNKNIEKLNKFQINFEKINKNAEKLLDFQYISNKKEEYLKNNIIYSPNDYSLNDILEFKNNCINHNKKPFLNLPIYATEKDIEILKEIVQKSKIGIVANNYYALNFTTEKIIGGGMNIYNSISKEYFGLPYIQAEDNDFKMPYMTMLHCPMKTHLGANCNNCPYMDGYEYVMQNGKTFKLKRSKVSTCVFHLVD